MTAPSVVPDGEATPVAAPAELGSSDSGAAGVTCPRCGADQAGSSAYERYRI